MHTKILVICNICLHIFVFNCARVTQKRYRNYRTKFLLYFIWSTKVILNLCEWNTYTYNLKNRVSILIGHLPTIIRIIEYSQNWWPCAFAIPCSNSSWNQWESPNVSSLSSQKMLAYQVVLSGNHVKICTEHRLAGT